MSFCRWPSTWPSQSGPGCSDTAKVRDLAPQSGRVIRRFGGAARLIDAPSLPYRRLRRPQSTPRGSGSLGRNNERPKSRESILKERN